MKRVRDGHNFRISTIMPRHELRDHLGIHQSLQYLSFQGNAEVMGGSPGLQKQISALKKAHDFILYSDIISLFFEQSSREMSGDIRKKGAAGTNARLLIWHTICTKSLQIFLRG
jgi:hypothetical protein